MIYQFECVETGELLDLDFPVAEAPDWGEVVPYGDRHVKRLVSIPSVKMGFNGGGSVQVAKNHPDAPRVDARGFPIFKNSQERNEFIARNNDRQGLGPKVEAE